MLDKEIHAKYYGNCILIYGEDTKEVKDILKLFGKWNPSLKGYVCYKSKKDVIEKFINKDILPADTKTKKELETEKQIQNFEKKIEEIVEKMVEQKLEQRIQQIIKS